MTDFLFTLFDDKRMLAMIFAAIAAGATVITLAMPLFGGDGLEKRLAAGARRRQGDPAGLAETVHADRGRQVQAVGLARRRKGPHHAGAGRIPRPWSVYRVLVLPPGGAGFDACRLFHLC